MKKLMLISAAALLLWSCQKESIKNDSHSNNSSSLHSLPFNPKIEIRGVFVWDDWGRKKRDCKGGGLCNFRLFDIGIGGLKTSNFYYDRTTGNGFTKIEIDNDFIFEDDSNALYVDEDIFATDPSGIQFVLIAGEYPFDSEIGDFGGYYLPLVAQ